MLKSKNKQRSPSVSEKKKRLKTSKIALSPIFATLIILAVVTVLFIPVFIWATGVGGQTEDSWQQSGLAATERIVIEAVSFAGDQSPQTCTIYVRDVGDTAITIIGAIISEADTNLHTYERPGYSLYDPITGNTLTSITKGNLMEIWIPDVGFTLLNQTTYTVRAFTSRGISDTVQVRALWYTK